MSIAERLKANNPELFNKVMELKSQKYIIVHVAKNVIMQKYETHIAAKIDMKYVFNDGEYKMYKEKDFKDE